MNADRRGLMHKELTETIIGVFFEVYNELGHGFLESVYENAFEAALTSRGLEVRRQIEVPVWFRGHKVGDFVADMLVERSVLLELKAVRTLDSSHERPTSQLPSSHRNRGWLIVQLRHQT
jgi:GxxExxY protein